MRELCTFRCDARAVPEGSLSVGRGGQIYHTRSKALNTYRDAVATACISSLPLDWEPLEKSVPVYLQVVFTVAIKDESRWGMWKTSAADLDKLTRAVGDALTGTLYHDDAQIAMWQPAKRWGQEDSTILRAFALSGDDDGLEMLTWLTT